MHELIVQPPSVFLPHIKRIKNCSRDDLADAVARLKRIYMHPQVRGSIRRRFSAQAAHSMIATAKLDSIQGDSDPTLLSADPFERNFTIQWLTRLISLNSDLQKEGEVDWDNEILEQAAALLAACAGTAASGKIERIFSFPFIPHESISARKGNLRTVPSVQEREVVADGLGSSSHIFKDGYDEIRVVLHDSPLETSDISSLGVQTWGGSCVLAEMIAEHPENFGIHGADRKFAGRMPRCFRALELGSGTGLASLVLGKVLERVRTCRSHGQVLGETDIPIEKDALDMVVATDFHPSVLANLRDNVERNFPPNSGDSASSVAGPQALALPLDWRSIYESSRSGFHEHTKLSSNGDTYNTHPITNTALDSPLFDVRFDVIIGADIVYEASHAQWVHSCVERFLRKPCTASAKLVRKAASANPLAQCASTLAEVDSAYFHLIIPLRRTHYFESGAVDEVFARSSKIQALREESRCCAPVLAIVGQEDIVCDAYTGEGDEVIYRYFKIGWV